MDYAHYRHLAELLDFPGPGLAARGKALADRLASRYTDARIAIESFLAAVPEGTVEQQELHTRTFEVQALTTLDAGYVLFGDDYKRGEMLSNLNREHAKAGNDCGSELADHLPNLLRLLPKLENAGLREELVREVLVPALMLMIREFDPERIERKNDAYRKHFKALIDPAGGADPTAYRHALRAVLGVLQKDFEVGERIAKLSAWNRRPQTVDFLGLVEKEIEVERDANPVNSGCDV